MTYTEHKITLDIHKTVSPVSVRVKKRDTGRRLLIHLADSGYPYHISEDCYAVFTAKKPDGKVVFNDCRIEECVIIYDFTEQTVAVAGLMDCEIILYGADGKQLTSACFNIIVDDTIYDTETEIESTDEYNALADLIEKVQKLSANGPVAQAIVRDADGVVISVTDASNQTLQGLRIFGKSTQDGTPTPDNPVEIVSVESPVITVSDGTETQTMTVPYTLPGIPVASGGNYTDGKGHQWICDEVDLARGVYVQRVVFDVFTSGGSYNSTYISVSTKRSVLRSTLLCNIAIKANGSYNTGTIWKAGENDPRLIIGNTGSDGNVVFASLDDFWAAVEKVVVLAILANPIETKLTADQLAAYAALHTYKPNTTIYNDAGAYMAAEYVADTKIYVDRNGGSGGSVARIGSVALLAAAWTGSNNLYSQVVTIPGVTANSQVDLTPSVEQLAVFYNKDLAFVTENEDGVVTVYAIGQKPTNDYTIQVTITEVEV